MKKTRILLPLLVSISILCTGCLAALLSVDSPKVDLKTLKKIERDVDEFFKENRH